ncbi:PqqD family protein [Pseudoalteromonas phenolica]|uniref:PqqD family protein n=1 Tax=Pseudoalteromonas phenolica TaxID=161398 RepID=UPI00384EB00B
MSDNNITLNSTVSRKDDVLDCNVDNETVLMSMDTGSYISTNKQAAIIWELIEQPKNITDIVKALTLSFDVDTEQCKSDVLSFIANMQKENLVTIS